jgi:pyridoxal phosphate enzyme (YggS family)
MIKTQQNKFLDLQNNGLEVVCVAKKRSVEEIKKVYDLGFRNFGENYSAELKTKVDFYKSLTDVKVHFIGRIQRSDMNWMDPIVSLWHSVDRMSVLERFHNKNLSTEFFLQVNPFKYKDNRQGFDLGEVEKAVAFARDNQLNLTGLMCIASMDFEPEATFEAISKVAEEQNLPKISMGMSQDYLKAIEFGATHIRIGRAVFNNDI